MCCRRLAGNTGCKNDAKIAIWAPSHNFVGRISTIEKRLVNQQYVLHMSSQYGGGGGGGGSGSSSSQ